MQSKKQNLLQKLYWGAGKSSYEEERVTYKTYINLCNKPKRKTEERDNQISLMKWADTHPICNYWLRAIPNGGSRNMYEAKSLKAQGVKPGTPDLFLSYPSKNFHGLWIEMKSASGKLSHEQKTFLEGQKNLGYETAVCYNAQDAISAILSYLT